MLANIAYSASVRSREPLSLLYTPPCIPPRLNCAPHPSIFFYRAAYLQILDDYGFNCKKLWTCHRSKIDSSGQSKPSKNRQTSANAPIGKRKATFRSKVRIPANLTNDAKHTFDVFFSLNEAGCLYDATFLVNCKIDKFFFCSGYTFIQWSYTATLIYSERSLSRRIWNFFLQ